MLTLGLAGGLDPVYEEFLDSPSNYTYDGAAVLVEDGRVVAAMEEERLNRIKRSNKFPLQAIQFCLRQHGVRAQDLDRIAYYVGEDDANALLSQLYLFRPEIQPRLDARNLFAATLGQGLQCQIDPSKLRFFEHKLMHAIGVMEQSGFEESLVLVIDEIGGVYRGQREKDSSVRLYSIVNIPPSKSLGRFCSVVLPFLGMGTFDEYKAMMLAPCGDPAQHSGLIKNLYDLLPGGDYTLRLDRMGTLIGKIEPRKKGQEPASEHKNLAAALQQAMEEIVLHILRHYREATGQKNLCIAGGMAENSATNGRVLASGMFDRVFVHPAAYDAGCALGAALLAGFENPAPRNGRLDHVYWGADIGDDSRIGRELENWNGFLRFEKVPDIARHTAELIANGSVVAWVQGRSEFGTHSLGNRCVLADPRTSESVQRVNKALNKDESFWPLAPSVLEEDARDFFELPADAALFSFKTFMVSVRPEKRDLLPATIDAHGAARLHVVSRTQNPRFWELIKAFKDITGIPVLLSTSFNNNSEPTVATVQDALASFVTSGVDHLAIGDFMVRKSAPPKESQLSMLVSLPPYVQLFRSKGFLERSKNGARNEIRTSYNSQFRRGISQQMSELLMRIGNHKPVRELLVESNIGPDQEETVLAELHRLWTERLVSMRPPAPQA
jgi:carbamoyltransferase